MPPKKTVPPPPQSKDSEFPKDSKVHKFPSLEEDLTTPPPSSPVRRSRSNSATSQDMCAFTPISKKARIIEDSPDTTHSDNDKSVIDLLTKNGKASNDSTKNGKASNDRIL